MNVLRKLVLMYNNHFKLWYVETWQPLVGFVIKTWPWLMCVPINHRCCLWTMKRDKVPWLIHFPSYSSFHLFPIICVCIEWFHNFHCWVFFLVILTIIYFFNLNRFPELRVQFIYIILSWVIYSILTVILLFGVFNKFSLHTHTYIFAPSDR